MSWDQTGQKMIDCGSYLLKSNEILVSLEKNLFATA